MKKKSSKAILIYLMIAVIIASVIRFFQYVSIMDFRTGLYKPGTEDMGALIYIILAAAAAGFVALTFFRKKAGDAAYTLSSDGMGNHATQNLGAGCAISAVMLVMKAISAPPFEMVISFIAVILFGAAGVLLLKNVVPPASSGYFLYASMIYMFIATAIFFGGDLIIVNHSDNVILLLSYVSCTVFLMSLARFCSRLETRLSRVGQIISGGLTFIFSGTHVIPKLIAMFFGGDAVKGMAPINYDAVVSFALSASFLFMLFMTIKKKDIVYLISSDEEEKAKPVKIKEETADMDADDMTDDDESYEDGDDSVEY